MKVIAFCVCKYNSKIACCTLTISHQFSASIMYLDKLFEDVYSVVCKAALLALLKSFSLAFWIIYNFNSRYRNLSAYLRSSFFGQAVLFCDYEAFCIFYDFTGKVLGVLQKGEVQSNLLISFFIVEHI